jgi:hypothetical protein
MTRSQRFRATIEQGDGGGAYVAVPFDVEAVFGRRRVPVQATIDGVPYRGSLVSMGTGCHVLGVLKAIRQQIGKSVGDTVEIVVALDDEPREVAIPDDLTVALDRTPEARAAFDRLSYTKRRELVRSITEAKRAETRERRLERAVELLRTGERT